MRVNVLIKRTGLLAAAAVMALAVCSCGQDLEAGAPEELVGTWACEELASDGDTDTGFYELDVKEDGTFSLYDVAAGNPGISGVMGNDSGGSVDCAFDEDDFDPPFCWEGLDGSGDTLDYEIDEGLIRIGYEGIWLTFHRAE